jgi:hypothetical protein
MIQKINFDCNLKHPSITGWKNVLITLEDVGHANNEPYLLMAIGKPPTLDSYGDALLPFR